MPKLSGSNLSNVNIFWFPLSVMLLLDIFGTVMKSLHITLLNICVNFGLYITVREKCLPKHEYHCTYFDVTGTIHC